jgi:glutathione S-transferase
MDVFFSPLACSMASRIVIYEAGGSARFVRVDTKTRRTADGQDYTKINPKGLVPAIRTDDGEVLTENAAVLQYLGDLYPDAALLPEGFGRHLVRQWLSFIGTELHSGVFHPLFRKTAGSEAKAFALEEAVGRFAHLNAHLEGRQWLLDRFSVADAYLAVVLNWAQFVKLDLAPYPHVAAYLDRAQRKPSIESAIREELALFQAA